MEVGLGFTFQNLIPDQTDTRGGPQRARARRARRDQWLRFRLDSDDPRRARGECGGQIAQAVGATAIEDIVAPR